MEIKERLDEIVKFAYELLMQKLSRGGIVSKNEASFQLELAYILKTLGQLYEFNKDDKFYLELEHPIILNETSSKSNSQKARADIYIEYTLGQETIKAALELKFLKKENGAESDGRWSVFTDLSNLEKYQQNKDVDLGYFILATDHSHYVNQEKYGKVAEEFDFRNGKEYKANTVLKYHSTKTTDDYSVCLSNDYKFNWKNVDNFSDNQKFYFLKVKVDCN